MATYLFSVERTLVGNPELSDDNARRLLLLLKAKGHTVKLFADFVNQVPEGLRALADELYPKPIRLGACASVKDDVTLVDDSAEVLTVAVRHGIKPVAAQQLGLWLSQEGLCL